MIINYNKKNNDTAGNNYKKYIATRFKNLNK